MSCSMPLCTYPSRSSSSTTVSPFAVKRKCPGSMMPAWTGPTGIWCRPSPSVGRKAYAEADDSGFALVDLALVDLALVDLALVALALVDLALVELALPEQGCVTPQNPRSSQGRVSDAPTGSKPNRLLIARSRRIAGGGSAPTEGNGPPLPSKLT